MSQLSGNQSSVEIGAFSSTAETVTSDTIVESRGFLRLVSFSSVYSS